MSTVGTTMQQAPLTEEELADFEQHLNAGGYCNAGSGVALRLIAEVRRLRKQIAEAHLLLQDAYAAIDPEAYPETSKAISAAIDDEQCPPECKTIATLEAELSDAREADARAAKTITELRAEVERLKAGTKELEAFRKSWQESSMEAQYKLHQVSVERDLLRAKLAEAEALFGSEHALCQQLEHERDEAQDRAAKAKRELDALGVAVRNADKHMAKQEARIKELEGAAAEAGIADKVALITLRWTEDAQRQKAAYARGRADERREAEGQPAEPGKLRLRTLRARRGGLIGDQPWQADREE